MQRCKGRYFTRKALILEPDNKKEPTLKPSSRLFAAAGLLAALPAFAQNDSIARVEQGLLPGVVLQGTQPIKRRLADEMARLGVPGVSVAVIRGGGIEWAKAYGVVTPGGAAVTPSTLFQAASLSKPVTAMAALNMVERGQFALDNDINSYTTRWKLPNSELTGTPATLRQLLSHTAGTTVTGFPGYEAGKPVPTLVQLLNGAAPSNTRGVHISSRPGSMWRYSGGGYEVVQYAMQERSKADFAPLMDDIVLKPLGMQDSTFAQPLSAALKPRAALPHDAKGKPIAGGPHVYPEQAAAGLWTTPSDMARFAIEVRQSAAGQSNKVLSQSMTQLMLSPVLSNFGLGLRIDGDGQAQTFSHGGSNEGYKNLMVAYSERGDGIVVMTNGDSGDELAGEVMRAVAAEYNWPTQRMRERRAIEPGAALLQNLPGKYAVGGGGDFTIRRQGNGLVIELDEGQSEPLYAGAADNWFILSRDIELRFEGTGNGRLVYTGRYDLPFTRSK
jgi:CubicO group peptidase (beta-lactamase class C family)